MKGTGREEIKGRGNGRGIYTMEMNEYPHINTTNSPGLGKIYPAASLKTRTRFLFAVYKVTILS